MNRWESWWKGRAHYMYKRVEQAQKKDIHCGEDFLLSGVAGLFIKFCHQ